MNKKGIIDWTVALVVIDIEDKKASSDLHFELELLREEIANVVRANPKSSYNQLLFVNKYLIDRGKELDEISASARKEALFDVWIQILFLFLIVFF